MTTPQDEIANLRAALEDIRKLSSHRVTYPCVIQAPIDLVEIRDRAARGLKTPRASKVVTVTLEGLPPPSYP